MDLARRDVTIRVLLGAMPRLLRDILQDILTGHDDLAVVGTCDAVVELPGAIALLAPDVAVVATERPDAIGAFVTLFRDHPDLRLLAIRTDARSASMHELRLRQCRVTDLSPAAILAALRASCDETPAVRSTPL